jgi:hypothetical protein
MEKSRDKEKSKPIKQFKDKSLNFWCNGLHFAVIEGDVVCCAGGKETEESRAKIIKYLKQKKLI